VGTIKRDNSPKNENYVFNYSPYEDQMKSESFFVPPLTAYATVPKVHKEILKLIYMT